MYQPFLQVRSNSLVTFDMWMGETSHRRFDFKQSERESYEGTMTEHARRRLTSCVDIMIQRNPTRKIWNPISESEHDFNINFITLTVSSHRNISAREGYDNLLSKWIRYMRDKYDLREYVWKAELQQRGQLHYHIATNTFIPWQVIRWKWNNEQKKAGLLQDYAKEFKNFNPNSVDVHKVEAEGDILGYISKEISKVSFLNVENELKVRGVRFNKKERKYTGEVESKTGSEYYFYAEWDQLMKCTSIHDPGFNLVPARLDGRIWDASETLKRKRFVDEIDRETERRMAAAIREGQARKIEVERCIVVKCPKPLDLLSDATRARWQEKILN